MSLYATDREIQDLLPDYLATNEAQAGVVARMIARESREIDRRLGVGPESNPSPVEAFPTATGTVSARVYWGTGAPYLEVHDYAGSIVSVVGPSGAVLDYRARRGQYGSTLLEALTSEGDRQTSVLGWPGGPRWERGAAYTVTADWGYAEPDDAEISAAPLAIVQACAIGVAIAWRRRRADQKLDTNLEQLLAERERILTGYERARALQAVGA